MASPRAASRNSKRKAATSAKSEPPIGRPDWSAFGHRTDLYARRVLGDAQAGELIVAGPLVRLACERHLRDRVLAAAAGGHPKSFWFNEAAADHIIQFYER